MGIGTGNGTKLETGKEKCKVTGKEQIKMSLSQSFKGWIAVSTGQILIQWIMELVSQKLYQGRVVQSWVKITQG